MGEARVELHDLVHLVELLDRDGERVLDNVPGDILSARGGSQRSGVATDAGVVDNVVDGAVCPALVSSAHMNMVLLGY